MIFLYFLLIPLFINNTSNIINLSPQHPATHGVLRLITISHAELIKWISPEIGLLHRGTEKLIECNYYNSNIGYSDRSDYVPGVIQELVFILILERIINCYGSSHIPIWRTLLIEFYRNPNHSLNITTHAIDIGLFTTIILFIVIMLFLFYIIH